MALEGAVSRLIYTLDELKQKIAPIARKYAISTVWVFGSYARGEARVDSDVDVLIKREGSTIRGLMIGALYDDLEQSLMKRIDLVTEESLREKAERARSPWFIRRVFRERVSVYESDRPPA